MAVSCQVWPHGDFPLQVVGRMVLDRNQANYYAEVEQIAFSVSHLVSSCILLCIITVLYNIQSNCNAYLELYVFQMRHRDMVHAYIIM